MFIQNFYDFLKSKMYIVFVKSKILFEIFDGNVKKPNKYCYKFIKYHLIN